MPWFQIRVEDSFDGSTAPSVGQAFYQSNTDPNVFVFQNADSSSLDTLGLVPWERFQDALGGKYGLIRSILYAGIATEVHVTYQPPSPLNLGNIIDRMIVPVVSPSAAGFIVPQKTAGIGLQSNGDGHAEVMILEVIAIEDEVDLIAAMTGAQDFGVAIPAYPRYTPARVVGPVADETVVAAGDFVLYDPTGDITLALPLAADSVIGDVVFFKNDTTSTDTLTVSGNGSQVEGSLGTFAGTQDYVGAGGFIAWQYTAEERWSFIAIQVIAP